MEIDRRHLLGFAAIAAGAGASVPRALAAASPIGTLGLDAAHFGLRPGSTEDQSRVLQNAIDTAARAHAPLTIAPGLYRAGNLKLPAGAQLLGVRGATQIVLTEGPSLLAAAGADHITLSGLVLVYVAAAGTRNRFRLVQSKYWIIFAAFSVIILFGIINNPPGSGPVLSGMRFYLRAIPLFFLPAVLPIISVSGSSSSSTSSSSRSCG